MALISQLSVNLNANTKGLEKGFKRARRKVKDFTGSIFNIKTAVAGALGIGGIGAMVGDLVSVNAEMQRLQSGLKTVTGGAENAGKAFDFIKEFSTTTPFELNQVTDAFIKLKNYGLDPSARALEAYGNMASGMGKSLNQMIEAVADATTGELERLKEFGIRGAAIKKSTDKLLTFRGETTRVALKDIQDYLINIAETNFGGAMADQMKNLGPSFSNLRTAVQDLKIAIGEGGLNTAITGLVTATTAWINTLDRGAIEDWTKSVINSFADFLDIGSKVYNYIAGNTFLQWGGIIGFALFGKLGLGAVALIDKVNTMMATDVAGIWEKLNPGIGAGGSAGLMPRDRRFRENYQLGDLNFPGGQDQRISREMLAEKYGSQIYEESRGQTSILGDIADILRQSAGAPATAG